MGLSSRVRVAACLAGAWALLVGTGCDPVSTMRPGHVPTTLDPFHDPVLRPGKPRVLVLMPQFPQTLEVWASLHQELAPDFDVITRRIDPDAQVELVARAIATVKPACVVVMNNPTLRLYVAYQQASPQGTTYPPAIVVMTSFFEEQAASVGNAIGIAYEVPAVTQFARLRKLIDRPIKRVGVIHRKHLDHFVQHQGALAKAEHIELVAVRVADAPTVDELRSALDRLLLNERVDALWVVNENALLTPALIENAWLPATSGDNPIPVVVGVAGLVQGSPALGTFAMIPDHEALGAQAASLVFELADADWQISGKLVEAPVSIKTIINGEQARVHFGFSDNRRDQVDEVVEP